MSTGFQARARAALAPRVVALLDAAGAAAERHGGRFFAVGGVVRDVLLGRATDDIDLVADDVAPALVRDLAGTLGARIEAESRFRTWRLALPDGRRLDLATARRESYPAPGALPEIAPASLEEDLARRDFTVNAMAVAIGAVWGELLDPHHGQRDLARGELAILHPASFEDDPTRILRGLELAPRLGFDFAPASAAAARQALAGSALDNLSPARFRAAWRRAFGRLLDAGPAPLAAGLELASRLGLWRALDPALEHDQGLPARLAALGRRGAFPRAAGAAPGERSALVLRACAWDSAALCRRLALRWREDSPLGAAWAAFGAKLATLRASIPGRNLEPSQVARLLAPFDPQERELLALAAGGEFDALLTAYETSVREVTLTITGRDLIAAGAVAGPALGRALEATLAARLDGLISGEDELQFARALLELDGR